ncbi:MAG: endopeptidase La [Acidobacteria bacterium CG_4_9_14_3_um_filter_49_7]|nr:MAG: endopeptidase La [Acidobacteria bacterium CG_4_9_14_3_um_filter_49_7]
MNNMTDRLPVLPLTDNVIFPEVETDIAISFPQLSVPFEYALTHGGTMVALATRSTNLKKLTQEQFFSMGTLIQFQTFITEKDGLNYLCTIRGIKRFEVNAIHPVDGMFFAEGLTLPPPRGNANTESLQQIPKVIQLIKKFPKLAKEKADIKYLEKAHRMADRPDAFADMMVFALKLPLTEKQGFLEIRSPYFRLLRLLELLEKETFVYRMEQELDQKVRVSLDENQKRYFLTEKMKAIREELGDDGDSEMQIMEDKIKDSGMSPEAEDKAKEELKRLKMMNGSSAEASVSRTYIQWLLDIPWTKRTRDRLDLTRARAIMDRDHYALADCKDRIIEFLAVRKLTRKSKNPILCFVGPPGVGKTSLAKAIAEATGRKFVRMSLGGVRDEAEIRGHRRTYIGAIPGRIIHLMKKAGTINPLMLLDEIDKLSSDFRGDPSSALLEALDPEQNHHFVDHYLDIDYDLSRVFFVVTANILDTIPPALRDRLEIIRIPGYTFNEKVEIARRHLIPKKVRETGMKKFKPTFKSDTIETIIEKYTREAGVRNLERNIEKLFRKFAVEAADGKLKTPVPVSTTTVYEKLGIPRFRNQIAEETPMVGVATGLAWTSVGGDVLFIEVISMPGNEKVEITGQLGDVMKESVKAALSFIKANHERVGIPVERFKNIDLHIHIPEGAIPKDGPSAGVTMATAIFSALANRPVSNKIAMTGEITLRGRVLAVGGIKEKLLAAHRAGIFEVIMPEGNERDLKDIPEEIKNVMEFHFVKTMDNVLDIMFGIGEPEPVILPSRKRKTALQQKQNRD